MTKETVNAEVKGGGSVSFEYDFGDTIEEANGLFGNDIIWAYAKRALIIAAQGYARGLLKSAKSVDEIRTAFETWKPGAPRAKQSPEDKFKALWATMSPEDRANMLREIQGEPEQTAAPRRAKS